MDVIDFGKCYKVEYVEVFEVVIFKDKVMVEVFCVKIKLLCGDFEKMRIVLFVVEFCYEDLCVDFEKWFKYVDIEFCLFDFCVEE